MRLFAPLTIAALLGLAGPATAQVQYVRYICDIEGMRGQLTAQLETLGGAGIVSDGRGNITGVIGGQGGTTYVSGQLQTPTALYTFIGENQFADFTDHTNGARFRVQWVPQPGGLIIVVNPFGDPVQYWCQQAG